MFVFTQVCHIVLGLRPGTPEEEGQIIRCVAVHLIPSFIMYSSMLFDQRNVVVVVCRGWLERESRHGLQQGQNWFLISMLWWQQWKDYVKYVSHVEELYILQTLR